MKLVKGKPAPVFNTHDVYGNPISLEKLRGQKVYLAFERNAGCPVCNLRMHELLKESAKFTIAGVIAVFIYESPDKKMKEFLGNASYPFQFVADPQNILYNLYDVERSMIKVMNAMFNGIFAKIAQGNKLFRAPVKQDGHADRIPAEFVIDENGVVVLAHYGKFVGDHIPKDMLFKILNAKDGSSAVVTPATI